MVDPVKPSPDNPTLTTRKPSASRLLRLPKQFIEEELPGMSLVELKIYLYLLVQMDGQTQWLTCQEIETALQIKRTSSGPVLRRLEQRGLVRIIYGKRRIKYVQPYLGS
ncbi:MAG: hypothetical protein HXX20_25115 [Chloroflexi bacterium]|nr:hypothetical protein [Chloroflexota bacterium]